MMTISRRPSVGPRHCSTYARKIGPLIGPSITRGATMPSWRRPATRVIVFQCPWGTDPTKRSPRRQRPVSLTILVLTAVSSINTSRAGLSMPCSRIHRRRARATSTRSCSAACRLFFNSDVVAVKKSPNRGTAAPNSSLVQRGNHLFESDVRPIRNQRQQPFCMLIQGRRTPSTRLGAGASGSTPTLQPSHRRTGAHIKAFGCLPPRRTSVNRLNYALPKAVGIGFWHRSEPPKSESMLQDSLTRSSLGIPR